MTKTEAQAKIDQIDDILAGPEKTVRAGREISYDFEALERTRNRLQRFINGGMSVAVVRYNTGFRG